MPLTNQFMFTEEQYTEVEIHIDNFPEDKMEDVYDQLSDMLESDTVNLVFTKGSPASSPYITVRSCDNDDLLSTITSSLNQITCLQ